MIPPGQQCGRGASTGNSVAMAYGADQIWVALSLTLVGGLATAAGEHTCQDAAAAGSVAPLELSGLAAIEIT